MDEEDMGLDLEEQQEPSMDEDDHQDLHSDVDAPHMVELDGRTVPWSLSVVAVVCTSVVQPSCPVTTSCTRTNSTSTAPQDPQHARRSAITRMKLIQGEGVPSLLFIQQV